MSTFITQAVQKTYRMGEVEKAIQAERAGERREAELATLNATWSKFNAERLELVRAALADGAEPDTIRFALDFARADARGRSSSGRAPLCFARVRGRAGADHQNVSYQRLAASPAQ